MAADRDPDRLPPGSLIAFTVQVAVMDATERNGKLIAHAASRARLGEAEMVRESLGERPHETGVVVRQTYGVPCRAAGCLTAGPVGWSGSANGGHLGSTGSSVRPGTGFSGC